MTGMVLKSVYVARHFDGTVTLNELLILNRACMYDVVLNEPVSVAALSRDLDIPRTTVSKIIKSALDRGLIVKERHEDDGRRYNLRFSDYARQATKEWADLVHEGRRKAAKLGYPLHSIYDIE